MSTARLLKKAARLPVAAAKRPRQTTRYFMERGADKILFPRYARRHPHETKIVEQVRAERLTFLGKRNLADIVTAVQDVDRRGLSGLLIEAGTALGGSAILMARVKMADRPLYVYDAFGMIPPPSERDGADVHERYDKIVSGRSEGLGGETYYGYREDLLAEVTASFHRHGVDVRHAPVHLVKGFFEDTIKVDEPVALAHIDADWHDSVMVCLERITPMLVPGGRFIIDDYYGYSGCRRAVDAFLAGPEGAGLRRERHSRLHLIQD